MTNNVDLFEENLDREIKRAELMSQADMIPEKFKGNPANVLVAREIASTMGESAWVTMKELYFVGNIPTFSAKYMRSRVRQAGHILREEFNEETTTARCVIIRKDDPDFEHVTTWDREKAVAHGLWGKGHWKKNPELMLKNRAVSECVREACNEVMGGVSYTAEEAEAMQQPPLQATATRRHGADGVRAALASHTTSHANDVPENRDAREDADDSDAEVIAVMLGDADKATSRDQLKTIAAAADAQLDGDALREVHETLRKKWSELS